MTVSFELPESVEQSLRREFSNLDQAAKEAAVVELYRQHKLSHYELSQALGLDRFETEDVLKKHNVTEDLPTLADLENDLNTLQRVLNRPAK